MTVTTIDNSIESAIGAQSLVGTAIERVEFRSPLTEGAELRIVNGVLFLCQYSSLHARYPVETLHQRIEPSLPRRQFHYYNDPRGVPVAFCNWAWLTASVLNDVLATGRDLQAEEFQCGDLPLLYEFLAPFGHCRAVARGLRDLPFFKGRCIPSIRGDLWDGIPHAPPIRYFHF